MTTLSALIAELGSRSLRRVCQIIVSRNDEIDRLRAALTAAEAARGSDLLLAAVRRTDFRRIADEMRSEHDLGDGHFATHEVEQMEAICTLLEPSPSREAGSGLVGEKPFEEWIDVVILGLDGAWRSGKSPEQIIETIVGKQTKNEGRDWPDWRTMSPDEAIEHKRDPASPLLWGPGPQPKPADPEIEALVKEVRAAHTFKIHTGRAWTDNQVETEVRYHLDVLCESLIAKLKETRG